MADGIAGKIVIRRAMSDEDGVVSLDGLSLVFEAEVGVEMVNDPGAARSFI